MIRGIYTSTSALRAATMHQARLAHNISNLHTTGFKQVLTTHQAYELQRLGEYSNEEASVMRGVGELESGLLIPEEIVDFSQGVLQSTERPLDLALEGPGFFRLQTPDGERFTRDGSFHSDPEGRLVSRDGHFVLDAAGQPILLPADQVAVTRDGQILAGDGTVIQLGLADFAEDAELVRDNQNLYRLEEGEPALALNVAVEQGYLEGSNVDENAQMMEMMRILRLYEASQRTLQMQDQSLTETLTIGEV